MAELFSAEWFSAFHQKWNDTPQLAAELAKINFGSVIGYGYLGEADPRGIIVVEDGYVTSSGLYEGQTLNWDIRGADKDWKKWMNKPPGMMGLGMAYTSRKMQFKVGDYGAMIKDPRMAGPFIKSFEVMSQV